VGFLQAFPAEVLSAVRLGLAMAVWAEHPQVFYAMVIFDAIDMVDVTDKVGALPFAEATQRTTIPKYPLFEQS
jgi:hypothetical protein